VKLIKGMTNAEYLKHLRVKARAKGMCGECRCRPAKHGRVSCAHCIARSVTQKQRLVAKAKKGKTLCTTCGYRLRRPRMLTCAGCAANSKRHDVKRRALGGCARCRWPAVPGTALCQAHHQGNRIAARAYYWAKAGPRQRAMRRDRKAA
jgi:hypothetical protein